MKRLLYCLSISFLMVSCLTKPDFPFQPSISFSSIVKKSIVDANNDPIEDSVLIEINFRDGNGDIGLSASDTTGNFSAFLPDKSRNPYYYNYYCTIYRRNKFSGEYERFPMPKLPPPNDNVETNLHGRVPPLLENARPSPIEGKLVYKIGGIDPGIFNKKDSIRFEVFIYDKALNKSNVINTTSILVNP